MSAWTNAYWPALRRSRVELDAQELVADEPRQA